jgi:prephenate dehydrogenase
LLPVSGSRRANVVGLGLIGGSIARALSERGWNVRGDDRDAGLVERAVSMGIVAGAGLDPDAEVTFVATPVLTLVDEVRRALGATRGAVTDVGSVKGAVVEAISDPRFVGGHPMACPPTKRGSEIASTTAPFTLPTSVTAPTAACSRARSGC